MLCHDNGPQSKTRRALYGTTVKQRQFPPLAWRSNDEAYVPEGSLPACRQETAPPVRPSRSRLFAPLPVRMDGRHRPSRFLTRRTTADNRPRRPLLQTQRPTSRRRMPPVTNGAQSVEVTEIRTTKNKSDASRQQRGREGIGDVGRGREGGGGEGKGRT